MADPNIIVIVLDSLRKDHLGCYGYKRNISPSIDELAEDGQKAKKCYASANASLFSHSSMFSGEPISQHGVIKDEDYFKGKNNLVKNLKKKNYTSFGISNNPFVSKHYGLDKEFDEFELNLGNEMFKNDEVERILRETKNQNWKSLRKKYLYALKQAGFSLTTILGLLAYKLERSYGYGLTDSGGKKSLDRMLEKSEELNEPFFMFTNLMETHTHYIPPIKFGRKFAGWKISTEEGITGGSMDKWDDIDRETIRKRKDYYDESIRYVDSILGDFVEKMEKKHPETAFIITADHGELFYDNNNSFEERKEGHGPSLSDYLLNVPFIIYGTNSEVLTDCEKAFSLSDLPDIVSSVSKSEKYSPKGIAISECFFDESEEFARMATDGKNKIVQRRNKTFRIGEETGKLEDYIKKNLENVEKVNLQLKEQERIENLDI